MFAAKFQVVEGEIAAAHCQCLCTPPGPHWHLDDFQQILVRTRIEIQYLGGTRGTQLIQLVRAENSHESKIPFVRGTVDTVAPL